MGPLLRPARLPPSSQSQRLFPSLGPGFSRPAEEHDGIATVRAPRETLDGVAMEMADDATALKAPGKSSAIPDHDADEDSPYPEVRAAVRNTDGGEAANTPRAWIIGLFFVTLGTGLHMFLGMR